MTTTPTPVVAILKPATGNAVTASCFRAIAEEIERAGWVRWTCKAERLGVAGAPGRHRELLESRAALELYVRLHAAPTLVLALGGIRVRVNPMQRPARDRKTVSVHRFVRHKACSAAVRQVSDVLVAFEAFDVWRASPRCNGDRDPRVLPLHTFEVDEEWEQLGGDLENKRFAQRHGQPRRRIDAEGRQWAQGPLHGSDVYNVAGQELSAGMHWDVTAGTGKRLYTPAHVFEFLGGHLNVGPDSRVRVPKSGARKIWPPQPAVAKNRGGRRKRSR